MKVLWVSNIVFPEAQQLLTGKGELKASGGWMLGAAEALLNQDADIHLIVAAPSRKVKKLTHLKGHHINYYVLPWKEKKYEGYWKKIKEEVCPDIVHIHGTEYSHGLAYVKACGSERVVISIQGLVSVYYRYYEAGMSKWDIIRNITIHDLIRGGIFHGKRNFKQRGNKEIELISSVKHIIGRTSWDKAHIWTINPNATYHFCNEILRKDFYTGEWCYEKCTPHTLFLSQAGYPIKGLHQLLKVMPLILRSYPDTQVRIAGENITAKDTLLLWLKRPGYGKYISRLIHKLHIEENVKFLGPLNAEQMKAEYLRANVFLCPSSIENSPNSLGEAQILGVPCITSYAGGIPDMMSDDVDNLYRFNEIEMMACEICQIFSYAESVMIKKQQEVARKRHNGFDNSQRLFQIYETVLKNTSI